MLVITLTFCNSLFWYILTDVLINSMVLRRAPTRAETSTIQRFLSWWPTYPRITTLRCIFTLQLWNWKTVLGLSFTMFKVESETIVSDVVATTFVCSISFIGGVSGSAVWRCEWDWQRRYCWQRRGCRRCCWGCWSNRYRRRNHVFYFSFIIDQILHISLSNCTTFPTTVTFQGNQISSRVSKERGRCPSESIASIQTGIWQIRYLATFFAIAPNLFLLIAWLVNLPFW